MQIKKHAQTRMQQRSIPQILIHLLVEFGTSIPAGDGASKMFFDKAARRRVSKYAGSLASVFNEYLDVYVVVSSNLEVITAAYLTERIRRQ